MSNYKHFKHYYNPYDSLDVEWQHVVSKGYLTIGEIVCLSGYISSLCDVVHEKMGSDVRNGDVFIFIGSSRKLMKLLHAEDGGMVMYVKRLEAGRFKLPEYDGDTQSYQMEWRDLVIMVEGIQESPDQRLRRLRAQRREYVV